MVTRNVIPVNEYKTEAFQLFENLLDGLREEVTRKLSRIRPMTEEEQKAMMAQVLEQQKKVQAAAKPEGQPEAPKVNAKPGFDESNPETWGNPGRNDLCPCGSGKKFKHCHGRLA